MKNRAPAAEEASSAAQAMPGLSCPPLGGKRPMGTAKRCGGQTHAALTASSKSFASSGSTVNASSLQIDIASAVESGVGIDVSAFNFGKRCCRKRCCQLMASNNELDIGPRLAFRAQALSTTPCAGSRRDGNEVMRTRTMSPSFTWGASLRKVKMSCLMRGLQEQRPQRVRRFHIARQPFRERGQPREPRAHEACLQSRPRVRHRECERPPPSPSKASAVLEAE